MLREILTGRSSTRSAGPFTILALTLAVAALPAVLCVLLRAERSRAPAPSVAADAAAPVQAPAASVPDPVMSAEGPGAMAPVLLFSIGEPVSTAEVGEVPETPPDWARGPYRIRRGGALAPFSSRTVKAACSAVNPNQRLVAYFGKDGIRLRSAEVSAGNWCWDLSLAASGPAGRTTRAAEPELSFEGSRVELRRDGLVEWYENMPHALVQGFTVQSVPGAAEVEIELAFGGTLTPTEGPGPAGAAIRLTDAAGKPVLDCRDLTAADASGRELSVRRAERAGRLVLAVSTAGATFPVTVRQQLIAAAAPPESYMDRVVELTNQERWDNGHLAPLKKLDAVLLALAAGDHVHDMAVGNFFSHWSLGSAANGCVYHNNEVFSTRITASLYSYSYAAENIAAGYATPESVMAAWMASSGHRANILRTTVREIGVGFYFDAADTNNVGMDGNNNGTISQTNQGPFDYYWCQDFGARASVYPVVINREGYQTDTTGVSLYVYGSDWPATQMRFSNDGVTWTAWQTYSTSKSWTLSASDGLKTVYCEIKNSGGSVLSSNDSIYLSGSTNGAPTITDFGPASPATVAVGTPQQFYIDCFDPDGDAMTYSWQIDGTGVGATNNWMDYGPADADAGTHTIKATVSDGHGHTAAQTWDVTVTTTAGPATAVSPKSLAASCRVKRNPAAQSFEVWNCGKDALDYTITVDQTWLSCTPAAGSSTGTHDTITVSYATAGLAKGTHTATITVTGAGAVNPAQTIAVQLKLTESSSSGGGGGGGCALGPAVSSGPDRLGWALPYLLVAGLYAATRLARRRRPALRA